MNPATSAVPINDARIALRIVSLPSEGSTSRDSMILTILRPMAIARKLITRLTHTFEHKLIALRMDHPELQEGRLLDAVLSLFLVRLGKPGQLDQNAVAARRLNDRLGHAKLIHPL